MLRGKYLVNGNGVFMRKNSSKSQGVFSVKSFIAVAFLFVVAVSLWPCDVWAARDEEAFKAKYVPKNIPKVSPDEQICFALYTVNNGILKLTAQMYPLSDDQSWTVRLEVKQDGKWKQIATTKVIEDGWTAPFRVENWDQTKTVDYRVAHGKDAFFAGTIQKDPVDKEVITVAAFTGNSVLPWHGGDISRADIVDNIKRLKPDLLFFSGDQVYNHTQHLKYWLKFGADFGEIIASAPTVTIPDDHDVGQSNLWGAEGKRSKTQNGPDGGYYAPAAYVKQVERAQTSHLPDPYDPTPVGQGIGVYYTSLNVGGISFAIIEDRKFKSGPQGLVPQQGPRPDHITDPQYDPQSIDVPGAVLLGQRQLKFLDDWGADWTGAEMKCVLSQTIFCGGAHIHGKAGGRVHADMDANGWPQTGRNKAVKAIRKAFALHLAGDQHLATIFHHGVDEFDDSMYSFCVPSIANLYLRWWDPVEAGKNRKSGDPYYLGQHLDGFGNKVTAHAVANPDTAPANGDKLTTRAAGFGIVKFNKTDRTITMECWPRNVDITDPANKPYPGWPLTINQMDNYSRKAVAYLPTIVVTGQSDPVIQIIDESNGEIIYTLRIKGKTLTPKVFRNGKYTIKVSSPDTNKIKTYTNVKSLDKKSADATIKVVF